MVFILVLLVGVGIVLAVVSLFSPEEDKDLKESQLAYHGALERTLRQLREQVFTLELDIKKNIRLALEMQTDIREIKEKQLSSVSGTVSPTALPAIAANAPAQTEVSEAAVDTDRIVALEKENKKLANRVASLSAQIDELTEERDAQERLIFQLREREARIREQLQRMQVDCEDLKKGLETATKNKLEIKDKLYKLKIISADNEKELERLRAENKELMDHLSYERNA